MLFSDVRNKMQKDQNRRKQSSFFSAVFQVSAPVMAKGLDLADKGGHLEVRKALAKESRGTAPEGRKANHRVSEGR